MGARGSSTGTQTSVRSLNLQRDRTSGPSATGSPPTEPRPRHTTALRRRLVDLSAYLLWHPFWSTLPGTPAARVELRRLAHHQEQYGTRAA